MLPEFFAFLGVDVFVAMSLLSCLLDDHFPKTLPYIFQAAAIGGYVHILISKEFLALFGDYMRFWYCVLYLAVALANVIAMNIYLALIKKQWVAAKVFSGAVVFPAVFVSAFFISNYATQFAEFNFFQLAMIVSALVLGLSVAVLVSPKFLKKQWKKEVRR
ncbi:MAG: hypothetical protein JSV64_02505 [Candidatus Bathyarchaeota archaeon]|nr:MAG: hypothetical protein JSV64_02505 [Candidatus Bathyarchaeota archaeon]